MDDQLKKTLILGGIAAVAFIILVVMAQNSINNRMFREIDEWRDESSNAYAKFLDYLRRSDEESGTSGS